MVGLSTIVFGVILMTVPVLLTYLVHFDDLRPRFLQVLGFHVQQTKYVNLISLVAIAESIVGGLMMGCTESSFVITAYYIRGLFKITRYIANYKCITALRTSLNLVTTRSSFSYRICNAIDVAANRVVSKNNATGHDCIRQAMDMHKKSIKFVQYIYKF